MSFRIQPQPVARPNRCQLFGPGSRPAIFEKMAGLRADVINLDLEDSVAPDDKAGRAPISWRPSARRLGQQDAERADQRARFALLVRDVVDLLEKGRERLDIIMIPKVGNAADHLRRRRARDVDRGRHGADRRRSASR
jgi:malyl-CoA/(S)-citramalyl-CoA lyase